ncbi:MAG: Fic family protein [Deltaproteobacteria bacterium]|jgi:Fic family protein|nr:Fic family protein [Deltaproteobacteria bacterium]
MLAVSGPPGDETAHFQAVRAARVPGETGRFIAWFNAASDMHPAVKAAVAHLWFVTVHPFADGNGRIARALSDPAMAAQDSAAPYYSSSRQILKTRESYHDMLEKSRKSCSLDITAWVQWHVRAIFGAVSRALAAFERTVEKSLFWAKAKTLPLGARQIRALSSLNHGFLGTLDSQVYAKMNSCSLSAAEAEFAQLRD